MLTKTKRTIFLFLFGGVFSALIYWAWDVSEGGSFDLVKFLVRILIFGPGLVFAFYVGDWVGGKKVG